MKKLLFTSFFILLSIGLSNLRAQQSIVPSYHPVYDWLYAQRVNGFIPTYSYESLPHRRIQIVKQLKTLEKYKTELSSHDQSLLQEFLNEFDHKLIIKKPYSDKDDFTYSEQKLPSEDLKPLTDHPHFQLSNLIKKPKSLFTSLEERKEAHVYQTSDESKNITIDAGFGMGYWKGDIDTLRTPFRFKQPTSYQTPYINFNFRLYGTFYKYFGFHYEHLSADLYNDEYIRLFHPLLIKNAKGLRATDASKQSYHTEGYTTFGNLNAELTLGRGLQKVGVGLDNNLVFSREGIAFNWLRLKYSNSWFTAMHMHGSLTWPVTNTNTGGNDSNPNYNQTKTSPSRWVVYQRFEFRPFKWMQLGWFELINYSERSMDLSYLNISNRMFFMEFENMDRDNGWVGLDVLLRPIKGVELYAELLVDDLSEGAVKDVFNFGKNRNRINNKFGRRLGITYSKSSLFLMNIDYTRIDQEVFTHKNVYNAHIEKGVLLGSQLGPNADKWTFETRKWLKNRSQIRFQYAYIRQALNYKDDEGTLVNVGANANISYLVNREFTHFLAGDLQKYSNFTLDYIIEPYCSIQLKSRIQRQWTHEGNRISNYWFGEFIVTIGMNYF